MRISKTPHSVATRYFFSVQPDKRRWRLVRDEHFYFWDDVDVSLSRLDHLNFFLRIKTTDTFLSLYILGSRYNVLSKILSKQQFLEVWGIFF
jgi:hypothetical protein